MYVRELFAGNTSLMLRAALVAVFAAGCGSETPTGCDTLPDDTQCISFACGDDGVVITFNTGDTCDDSDVCSENDVCTEDGECRGEVDTSMWDDANPCTVDFCDPTTGIMHEVRPPDDANPCTEDQCDPATGLPVYDPVPMEGSACNDEDPCSADDACVDGACTGTYGATDSFGNPIDDGDPCTDDGCDDSGAASHVAKNVDDGSDCTVDSCDPSTGDIINDGVPFEGDSCGAGAVGCIDNLCRSGACVAVIDYDLLATMAPELGGLSPMCTDLSCDRITGEAVWQPMGEGTGCDDNNRCTASDVCRADGVCAGSGENTHGATCDDGDACTAGDRCDNGSCEGFDALAEFCSATNDDPGCFDPSGLYDHSGDTAVSIAPCLDYACNQGDMPDLPTGIIVAAMSGPCDDGNTCSTSSSCLEGECVGDTFMADGTGCDDTDGTDVGRVETDCDQGVCEKGVCQDYQPISGVTCFYPGLNECNNYTCNTGNCLVDTTTPLKPNTEPCTDDGFECTSDHCAGTSATCLHEGAPMDGTDCTGGNPCQNFECNAGFCQPDGTYALSGTSCAICGVCDGTTAGCGEAGDERVCDDGNSCTSGDQCVDGAGPFGCQGTTTNWDAGVAPACDDGDPCTINDRCNADASPTCEGGPTNLPADDGNPCTHAVCFEVDPDGTPGNGDEYADVVNVSVTDGTPCEDGNPCTQDDVCLVDISIDPDGVPTCHGTIVADGLMCDAVATDACVDADENMQCDVLEALDPDDGGCWTQSCISGACELNSAAQDGQFCGADIAGDCMGRGTCSGGACSDPAGAAEYGQSCTPASVTPDVECRVWECDEGGDCNRWSGNVPNGTYCGVCGECNAGFCENRTGGTCDDENDCTQADTCTGGGVGLAYCAGTAMPINTPCGEDLGGFNDADDNCSQDVCDNAGTCQVASRAELNLSPCSLGGECEMRQCDGSSPSLTACALNGAMTSALAGTFCGSDAPVPDDGDADCFQDVCDGSGACSIGGGNETGAGLCGNTGNPCTLFNCDGGGNCVTTTEQPAAAHGEACSAAFDAVGPAVFGLDPEPCDEVCLDHDDNPVTPYQCANVSTHGLADNASQGVRSLDGLPCGPGAACSAWSCDGGRCAEQFAPDGWGCGGADDNECTLGESCANGVCGEALEIDWYCGALACGPEDAPAHEAGWVYLNECQAGACSGTGQLVGSCDLGLATCQSGDCVGSNAQCSLGCSNPSRFDYVNVFEDISEPIFMPIGRARASELVSPTNLAVTCNGGTPTAAAACDDGAIPLTLSGALGTGNLGLPPGDGEGFWFYNRKVEHISISANGGVVFHRDDLDPSDPQVVPHFLAAALDGQAIDFGTSGGIDGREQPLALPFLDDLTLVTDSRSPATRLGEIYTARMPGPDGTFGADATSSSSTDDYLIIQWDDVAFFGCATNGAARSRMTFQMKWWYWTGQVAYVYPDGVNYDGDAGASTCVQGRINGESAIIGLRDEALTSSEGAGTSNGVAAGPSFATATAQDGGDFVSYGPTATAGGASFDSFYLFWPEDRPTTAYGWRGWEPFADIAATGERLELVSNCDDCCEAVDLYFPIFIDRYPVRQIFVCADGYVHFMQPGIDADFSVTSVDAQNRTLSDWGEPSFMAAPFWSTLIPGSVDGGNVFWEVRGLPGERQIIVMWNKMDSSEPFGLGPVDREEFCSDIMCGSAFCGCATNCGGPGCHLTFEVILHEGLGTVEFRYDSPAGSFGYYEAELGAAVGFQQRQNGPGGVALLDGMPGLFQGDVDEQLPLEGLNILLPQGGILLPY